MVLASIEPYRVHSPLSPIHKVAISAYGVIAVLADKTVYTTGLYGDFVVKIFDEEFILVAAFNRILNATVEPTLYALNIVGSTWLEKTNNSFLEISVFAFWSYFHG